MAQTKPCKKDIDFYTIKGTNKVVRSGDCVLIKPLGSDKLPHVARVEKIKADCWNNVKVRVRWYYRPEESMGGRRPFHGAKELFLSDQYDVESAYTIEGKCIVHTFKSYTKLENVGAEDYYCRFEYKASTGLLTPDRVAVYCKCEMPYNPDCLMVQCEGCKDWFHPSCMGMTIEEAKKLDQFLCSDCFSEDDTKRSLIAFPVSPSLEEQEKHQGALQGVGRTLGSSSSSNPSATASKRTAAAGSITPAPDPSMGLVVDSSLPTTFIQLRLADGTRMVSCFNYHLTIRDIRSFIDASRPIGARNYQLLTMGFPPKQLTDLNQTIEQAGIANSVVIQKY
ncbi:hypothetical protein REPUB_Repub17cG0023300 [Reevesia pubescens]